MDREQRRRLRSLAIQLVKFLDLDAPDLLVASAVANVFWAAAGMVGKHLWPELGKVIDPHVRNRSGKCGGCDADIAAGLTHPHECPDCVARNERMADEIEAEMRLRPEDEP